MWPHFRSTAVTIKCAVKLQLLRQQYFKKYVRLYKNWKLISRWYLGWWWGCQGAWGWRDNPRLLSALVHRWLIYCKHRWLIYCKHSWAKNPWYVYFYVITYTILRGSNKKYCFFHGFHPKFLMKMKYIASHCWPNVLQNKI